MPHMTDIAITANVSGEPPVAQTSYGRTTRIQPRRMTVSISPTVPGLHVYIEGRRIKLDGSTSQLNGGVSYSDQNLYHRDDAHLMSNLPAWAVEFVGASRVALAAAVELLSEEIDRRA